MNYRIGKRHRIGGRGTIGAIFQGGLRAGDGCLLVIGRANQRDDGLVRGAVLVSKKHGAAVQRNRIKRLTREAIRLERPNLPRGHDFLLLPRAGMKHNLADLRKSLVSLTQRIGNKSGTRERECHE